MFQQLKIWHLKAWTKKKKKLEPTLKHQFKTWHKQGAMFHMFGGNLTILPNVTVVVYEFVTCQSNVHGSCVKSEFSCGCNKGVSFVFSLSRKQLEMLLHESQSIKKFQKKFMIVFLNGNSIHFRSR
jgi:hypothetical protein